MLHDVAQAAPIRHTDRRGRGRPRDSADHARRERLSGDVTAPWPSSPCESTVVAAPRCPWHAHEMAAMPETAYARDGDHHLAYQVVGDSGADLLFVPTATFPIDLLWEEPTVAGPCAGWRRSAA